jgi:hypothetical protein
MTASLIVSAFPSASTPITRRVSLPARPALIASSNMRVLQGREEGNSVCLKDLKPPPAAPPRDNPGSGPGPAAPGQHVRHWQRGLYTSSMPGRGPPIRSQISEWAIDMNSDRGRAFYQRSHGRTIRRSSGATSRRDSSRSARPMFPNSACSTAQRRSTRLRGLTSVIRTPHRLPQVPISRRSPHRRRGCASPIRPRTYPAVRSTPNAVRRPSLRRASAPASVTMLKRFTCW